MNEMNELETQLRMWAPRRPSAALKQRIFASRDQAPATCSRDDRPETESSPTSFRLSWLAPVAVCVVAMCALFVQRNPVISASGDSGPMMAVIMSNHSASAYSPAATLAGRNGLPADTFEWTNRSGSTSSIRSLAGSRGKN